MTMVTPIPGFPVCRACNTRQRVRVHELTFVRHPDASGLTCPGSGKTRGQVDDIMRTFDCWENTNEVVRRTQVVDNADSVSLVNTLSAASVTVEVATRLQPGQVLRLIDELGVIARERGWRSLAAPVKG